MATSDCHHSLPLVSCILPTFNRKRFLPQAIKYFLNQTYNNKELVIVDDGSLPIDECIPKDSSITYVKLPGRTTVGQKLNIGIEHSHGEIIQKMDDDDYYHPRFLSTTVTALRGKSPKTNIIGFDCFLVLIAQTGEVKFSGHGWCAGGTLCFFRELWEKIRFQDVSGPEDWCFLRDSQAEQIKVHDAELYMLVRHGDGHIWTRMDNADVTESFCRQPSYRKRLEALVSIDDLEFYRTLRAE
jgi:glycosyltransferase involved in cell wall biosynthesis